MNFNLLKHIRDNDDTTVVWIFNIGTEQFWNGKVFTIKDSKENIIVNHMEEMMLLLTREQDIAIMSVMPDEHFLNEMSNLGIRIPHILCPSQVDETKTISQLVLEDETFKARLDQFVTNRENTVFVPYGVSYLEEEIAEKLNLVLFGAPSTLCKKINDKIFSRHIAIEQDFNRTQGKICNGLNELEETAQEFLSTYKKIVIKEPCGASGQGLWVVDNERKLKSVLLIIRRFFKSDSEKQWLIEEWCEKETDINYQIYVGLDGTIDVFSVKEQIVNETIYVGSVMPPRIPESIINECKLCGQKIGKALYEMGYVGILGVDGVILKTGELIPIIEINGRFTLSTYLSFVLDHVQNKLMFGFYKKILLNDIENYRDIKKKLTDEKLWIHDQTGGFIYVSETINKKRVGEYGRMFAIILGSNMEEIMGIYNKVNRIMEEK